METFLKNNDRYLHHPPSGLLWLGQSHYMTWPCLGAPREWTGICTVMRQIWTFASMAGVCITDFVKWGWKSNRYCRSYHLVGTGTSVRPPSVVAWARRTKATKGLLRKSTSPTKTFDASASLGIFFMNLFFSYRKWQKENMVRHHNVDFVPILWDISQLLVFIFYSVFLFYMCGLCFWVLWLLSHTLLSQNMNHCLDNQLIDSVFFSVKCDDLLITILLVIANNNKNPHIS